MRKKLLTVCALMACAVCTLGAKAFDLSLGGLASYNVDAESIFDDTSGLTDIDNWNFGGGVDMKLFFVDLGLDAWYNGRTTASYSYTYEGQTYDYLAEDLHEFSVLMTAGVSFDFWDMLRVGVGLGPRIRVLYNDDTEEPLLYQEDAEKYCEYSWDSAWKHALLSWRLSAELMFNHFGIGVLYVVDSEHDLSDISFQDIFTTNWESGRFGVRVAWHLF